MIHQLTKEISHQQVFIYKMLFYHDLWPHDLDLISISAHYGELSCQVWRRSINLKGRYHTLYGELRLMKINSQDNTPTSLFIYMTPCDHDLWPQALKISGQFVCPEWWVTMPYCLIKIHQLTRKISHPKRLRIKVLYDIDLWHKKGEFLITFYTFHGE